MGPELTFITLKKDMLIGGRDSAQSCVTMGEAVETFYNIEVTTCRLLNEMENLKSQAIEHRRLQHRKSAA